MPNERALGEQSSLPMFDSTRLAKELGIKNTRTLFAPPALASPQTLGRSM